MVAQSFNLILVFLTCFLFTEGKYSCTNPSGDDVDWFTIFMIPKSSSQTDEITFGYFDNTSTTMKYTQYKKGNFPPITMTYDVDLQSTKKQEANYFFWNDDDGELGAQNKAHSKGALVYDKNGGYFLSHSLPRFPYIVDKKIANEFPENAGVFAQSWLCISVTKSDAIEVARQLTIINPNVFANIDSDQVDTPPNDIIIKLIKNRGDPKSPPESKTSIQSRKKTMFNIFSKSKVYNDLQWDKIIPDYYSDDFYSETWTKPERLKSVCSGKYNVLNVLSLKFDKFQFAYNNEHSKWGVAVKKNVICFGDLNRTESQKSRGGLATCFEDTKLANIVRKAITDNDDCKKSSLTFLS